MKLSAPCRIALLLLAFLALWPLTGSANAGIPGPMIILGSSFYGENFWRWILVNMVMCISVEGFVFLYSREYRRPFAASAYANIVSLVLGYPVLFFLFLSLGSLFPLLGEDYSLFSLGFSLGCTIGSFFIEYHALKLKPMRRFFLCETDKISFKPVLLGNLLTNLIMLIYIVEGDYISAGKKAFLMYFWS
jgi:hypothetical protein